MSNTIDFDVISSIQYGMFIVTSAMDGKMNGQIATVVFQVTNNPIKIATCINKNNFTHELMFNSKTFGISIISDKANFNFIGNYGFKCGRNFDKISGSHYKKLITKVPLIVDNTIGIIDLLVVNLIDIGTHSLFIGEVCATEKINEDSAMTYDFYHNVIKGKTNKNAPNFNINNK